MDLDRLAKLIETLKTRIEKHGNTLRDNEIRTRMALIDPLLQALGWEPGDPAVVAPEYNVGGGGGRADYALLQDGKPSPIAIIEAKKFGESLLNHRQQMVGYAVQDGIRYAGLTDGNIWELYDINKPVPLKQKQILDVKITDGDPHRLALKLLLLWQRNLPVEDAIHAPESIFTARKRTEPDTLSGPPVSASVASELPDVEALPLPNVGSASEEKAREVGNWIRISSFHLESGTKARRKIKFPDGTTHDIRFWTDLIPACASWLWEHSNLKGKLPVKSGPVQYICHTQPRHINSARFSKSRKAKGTPVYCEIHGNAKQLLENAKKLLRVCEQDLDSVMVLDNPD